MVLLMRDPEFERRLIADRRKRGLDLHDEVRNGVYVMSSIADDDHQGLATGIASVILMSAGVPTGTRVRAGVNVSDRAGLEWRKNFRVPDIAVILPGSAAKNCGTHWHGGPDFVAEIVSRGDRSRKKLSFYAKVGTREVLLVHRRPWSLELYRLDAGSMVLAGRSTLADPAGLASNVVPLSFRLAGSSDPERPSLVLARLDGSATWTV